MIQTVTGAVEAASLGAVSTHEHLLADAGRLQRAGASAPPPGPPVVRPEVLGYLRWNMLAFADNLVLDDAELAAAELAVAASHGLSAVIESTSWGLGPDHARLPGIARASGVDIAVAYGTYIRGTLPPELADLDEDGYERLFLAALESAVPGTDYRAAMLGIIGTTAGLPRDELPALRAAARAAASTGAAVSIRLDPDARDGLDVVDIVTREGLSPTRIVFTNGDEFMDAAYWADLAATDAVIEMCFGTEAVHLGRVDNPSDRERLAFFTEFVGGNPTSRHVLGGSVWTKAQLRAYGGCGYGHVLETIVPELHRRGVDVGRTHDMLVLEPARILDR